MTIFGDNPFDDGLDFIGCPPKPAKLKLPRFPEDFKGDCKLICWARCRTIPDGEKILKVSINNFKLNPEECGVYVAEIHFHEDSTGDEWYRGKLKFYYTRNYVYSSASHYRKERKTIAFRFVVKGDIVRVSDKMPEWTCLILCTKKTDKIESYERIFVYGGLDILFDDEIEKVKGFLLSLGHNDGWYTHHPKCSKRPIAWTGSGDYIGHYSERGWLFVSPEKNFVFNSGIRPPTGRFFEEALRESGKECYTEEAIRYGAFDFRHVQCIHWYQELMGFTECKTSFESAEFCQGLVYTQRRFPWVTFFSMGYWMDRYEKKITVLHLVEGNIRVENERYEKKYGNEHYFYGFATHNDREELKLVDLASNQNVIGEPANTHLLLYLYNAGAFCKNPRLLSLIPEDLKLSLKLVREEREITKEREICSFLQKLDEQKSIKE
jgi:hypothetical protein